MQHCMADYCQYYDSEECGIYGEALCLDCDYYGEEEEPW